VLIVSKVTQRSAGGYAEYLEGKSQAAELGDYYLKDGERVEAPGRWVQGATAVGADPALPVSGDELRALMAVRRPDTGEPLRATGASGEAVSAIDATFSAPKSVSATWAIADSGLRTEIERAHEAAIDRALEYSLAHVPMTRERLDQRTVIHTKPTGVIATSWRHTTARAVGDQPPDPQLHSHVLLHGAVRGDGRVVAIDSRMWLVHQREIGAAYRSELARELNRLGFEIERGTGRGGRYFEIAGIPPELVDRWSSRHRQVQAAIEERLAGQEAALLELVAAGGPDAVDAEERLLLLRQFGQLTPAEERLMSTITRTAKAPVTHRDLDEHWRETAGKHGFRSRDLGGLRGERPALHVVDPEHVLDGLTEFDATFPARDARAVALERSAGAPIDRALDQLRELRNIDQLLLLADGSGTTREHRVREQATVAIAQRLADREVPPIAPELVARETSRLDRELAASDGRLSEEQRQAIELACRNKPLVVIEGHAGTGKSTTLTGMARAHQASGRQIIVTSTAGVAAERLAGDLAAAGVQTSAYSTAALQAGIAGEQIPIDSATTIVHDEAALASTREQQQLLAVVEKAGARLIEIGDPKQSQPIGAGGLWTHLEHTARAAGAHAELTRNQRALDPADRRDQARFREGEHEHAIHGYADRDRVHLHTDQTRVEDAALEAAQADRDAGRRTLVISQTSNEHLDQLNARAQAIRQQHRQLGTGSLPLPGRPYALHAGDEVQVRRTIPHQQVGPLRNGTTARVTDIDPGSATIGLRLANGHQVDLDRNEATRADLRLAYVQHPFPSQGHTSDTAHVIVGEHATREGTYVALTRARQATHIYAAHEQDTDQPSDPDPLAVLADRVSRAEPEVPSIHAPLAEDSSISTRPQPLEQAADPSRSPAPAADDDHDSRTIVPRRRWPDTRDLGPQTRTVEIDRGIS
jgi:conjugative relaxase-like TrwC/TraI family protein